MSEFQRIAAVVEKTAGGGTPDRSNSELWNGDIPWASVKDFKDGSSKLPSIKESISDKGLKLSSSNLVKEPNKIRGQTFKLNIAFLPTFRQAF